MRRSRAGSSIGAALALATLAATLGSPPTTSADVFSGSGELDLDRDYEGSSGKNLLGQREDGDSFGHAVEFGDFDGDGHDDLAIGTPGDDVGGVVNAGAVNVLYGSPEGYTLERQDFWDLGDAGVDDGLEGSWNQNDFFGFSLAAGDFDGDGYDELAVGAPGRDYDGEPQTGGVYVLQGTADGLAAKVGATSVGQFFTQDKGSFPGRGENDDQLGLTLAAGEFDGDEYDDLLIGTPYEDFEIDSTAIFSSGAVVALKGTANGLNLSGATSLRPQAINSSMFGWSLDAGDVTGDGIDDAIVGAPLFSGAGADGDGAVFVWRGGEPLTGNPDYSVGDDESRPFPESRFGWSVTSGDFDDDGTAEVVVGQPAGANGGKVHVVALDVDGEAGGRHDVTTFEPGVNGLRSASASSDYGNHVAVGEFDGDGALDLIASGSPNKSSLVISGRRGIGLTPDRAVPIGRAGAVATGDANNDGVSDVAIGSTDAHLIQVNPSFNPVFLSDAGKVLFRAGWDNSPEIEGPQRFLDTRPGQPTIDGEFAGVGRAQAGEVVRVQVAGRGTVPDGARAAIVNVAIVNPTAKGYATLFPCNDSVPLAATINFDAGETRANTSIPALSASGELCIFTLSGTDIVLDVSGSADQRDEFIAAETPLRVLDTRESGETYDGQFQAIGRAAASSIVRLDLRDRPFDAGYVDYFLNLAVVNPGGPGYATVFPCSDAVPTAAAINYEAGQTVSNGVLARASDDGEVCIFTFADADLVVDLTGFTSPYAGIDSSAPLRVLETRTGQITADRRFEGIGPIEAGEVLEVPIAGRVGIPDGATSVFLNLAVIGPAAPGFATLFPCTDEVPTAANVNFAPGPVTSNNAVVRLSPAGSLCIFSSTTTHFVVDITAAES